MGPTPAQSTLFHNQLRNALEQHRIGDIKLWGSNPELFMPPPVVSLSLEGAGMLSSNTVNGCPVIVDMGLDGFDVVICTRAEKAEAA